MGKSIFVFKLFDFGWFFDNDFLLIFNNLILFFICFVDIYINLFKYGIILGKNFDFIILFYVL